MLHIRLTVAGWLAAAATLIAAAQTQHDAPFHIQAHRGAGIAMPENTLETFVWAWEHQITPEADLRVTKDGAIVCFHDGNFKRVVANLDDAHKSASIEKLPLAEVQKFDVGTFRGKQFAGEHVPTLISVFAAMHGHPDRLIYLDIKTIDLDLLARLVRQYGVERQVIFTTFDHRLIRDWKKRVPESLTLLWNGGSEKELAAKMDALRKVNFEGITHLQIHVQVGDISSAEPFMPSSAFIKSLGEELAGRDIVFQVLPWECKDERAYEKLLALGVDSFATDYPELTSRAVKSFREKERRPAGDSRK